MLQDLNQRRDALLKLLDGDHSESKRHKDVMEVIKKVRKKNKKVRRWTPAQRAKFIATMKAKRE